MSGFFQSLFKSRPPLVVEDPVLGTLSLKDKEWRFPILVENEQIEASIPDIDGRPCAGARSVAEKSVSAVNSLWTAAVGYTIGQIAPLNPRFKVEPSEFKVEAVSFHAPGKFEGGEVVFWFKLAGDKDGGYFVPLHNGVPLLWHRDS
jgi:hypothetical protein